MASSRSHLHVRALGGPLISLAGTPINTGGPLPSAILFILSWMSPRTVTREKVLSYFWPDGRDAERRHRLSQHLFRLRRVVGGILHETPHGLSLPLGSVQVEEKSYIETPIGIRDSGAVALGTDSFCSRLRGRFHRSFEDWIDSLALSYHSALMASLERSMRLALDGGDWRSVRHYCDAILRLEPDNHAAHYQRAHAAAADGALGAAMKLLVSAPKPVRTAFRKQLRPTALAAFQRTLQVRHLDTVRQHAPRFVGRNREFASLLELWQDARRGSARTVVIRGEPGIGKSRLAEKLLRAAVLQGARAFYGRATEAEAHLPFSAVRDCYQSGLRDVDLQRLAGWAKKSLARLFPGLDVSGSTSRHRSAEAIVAAFVELNRDLLSRSPVVLFLDDAHWADTGTLMLFAALQRSFEEHALLVMLAYRPEHLKGERLEAFEQQFSRAHERLDLRPIADTDLDDLFESVDAALCCRTNDQVRIRLREAVGGRPLLLLETIRDYIHSIQLPAASDNASLSMLSPRVRGLFEARLQRVAPTTRDLLTCVAVVGSTADFRLVRGVLDVSDVDWAEALHEALRTSLIVCADDRLVFTHDIARDAVLCSAMSLRVAELHEAVGRRIAGDKSTPPAVVAYHFDRAGCHVESLGFYMRAAQEAEQEGSLRDAEQQFARASEIASESVDRYRALDGRLRVLCMLRAFGRAQKVAEELWPHYLETRNSSGLLRCKLVSFAVAFYSEATVPIDSLLPRALDLCRLAQDERCGMEAAESLCFAAELGHDLADGAFMAGFLPAMRYAGEQMPDCGASAVILAACANVHLLAIDASVAHEIAMQALGRARGSGQLVSVCRALGAAGNALIGLGRYDNAVRILTEGSDLAQANGLVRDWCGLQTALGVSLLELGERQEAHRVLLAARQNADHHQSVVLDANLLRLAFENGDFERTYSGAIALHAGNARTGAPWVEAVALSFYGLCAHGAGKFDEVRSIGGQLVRLLDRLSYTGFDLSFAALFLSVYGRSCGEVQRIAPMVKSLGGSTFMAGALRAKIAWIQLLLADRGRLHCRAMLEEISTSALKAGAHSVAARAAAAMQELDMTRS